MNIINCKIGDKIKCIGNSNGGRLTLNKIYDIIETSQSQEEYQAFCKIIDDEGGEWWVRDCDFKPMTNQKGETKMANKTILKVFGKEKLEDVELIKKHLTDGANGGAIRQELINEIVIKANKADLLALAQQLEKKEIKEINK